MNKITSYVLLGIAVVLLGFNLFTIDYSDVFGKETRGSLFGAIANLCVTLIVFINLTSQKIKEKVKETKD
jgi:xanthine/uracil permease